MKNALCLVLFFAAACEAPPPPYAEGLPTTSEPTLPPQNQPMVWPVAEGFRERPTVDQQEPVDEPEPPTQPDEPDEPDAPDAPQLPDVASCPRVQVVGTGGVGVNVRPGPSTSGAPLGLLEEGVIAEVRDVVAGQEIEGVSTWFEVSADGLVGFISGAFGSCDIDPVAACPRVQVVETGGVGVNVRPGPSTSGTSRGVLPAGAVADVLDIVEGQSIEGESTWYEIDAGDLTGFISGAFASCAIDDAAPPDAFLLPLPCGMHVTVTQGNNTNFSHTGANAYAFDFGIPSGTPLLAIKDGVVIAVDEDTQPGDPCYSGGDSSCINEANGVTLRHPDGTTSLYAHVNSVEVSLGQSVRRGQVVALSGGTGWSTGPHAHVQRQTDCGYAFCQSIPMAFADVAGDGVPVSGEAVTSQNGCF